MRSIGLATGLVIVSVSVSMGVIFPSFVQAGHTRFRGYVNRAPHWESRGYGQTFHFGYENGYRDAFEHGDNDAHQSDFNFWHDPRYRYGDYDYHPRHGSRSQYVLGYRQGYEKGYWEAFARRQKQDKNCDY